MFTWGHTWWGERGNGEYGSEFEVENAGSVHVNPANGFEWELTAPARGRAPVYPRNAAAKVVTSQAEEPLGNVVQVASGKRSVFALTRTETGGNVETQLWGWGNDAEDQFATPLVEGAVAGPESCPDFEGLHKHIATAEKEWVARKGPQKYIVPSEPCSVYPVKITIPGLRPGEYITQVAAGQTAEYVVTSQGRVFAWGSNQSGEIGRRQDNLKTCGNSCHESNERIVATPVEVSLASVEGEGVPAPFVTSVSAGGKYAVAKLANGDVIGWGGNEFGQITGTHESTCFKGRSEGSGVEAYNCHPEPKLIGELAGASALSAGWNTTLAIVGGEVLGVGADTEDELLGPGAGEPAAGGHVKAEPCLPVSAPKEGSEESEQHQKEVERYVKEVARDSCSATVERVQGVPAGGAVAISAGTGEGLELQHNFAVLSSRAGVIAPLVTATPGPEAEELTVEWNVPDIPGYEALKASEGTAEELQLPPVPFGEPLSALAQKDEGVAYSYGVRWARVKESEVGGEPKEPEWVEKSFQTVTCEPLKPKSEAGRCEFHIKHLPLQPEKTYMVDLRLSPGANDGSFKADVWGDPKP